MDAQPPAHPSHLFTLRVWCEDLGDGKVEWRGQVRHVLSGRVSYFRDWLSLVEFLRETSQKAAREPESK